MTLWFCLTANESDGLRTRDLEMTHVSRSCFLDSSWYPVGQKFQTTNSSGYLDVVVPKSHWAEKVVAPWNLFHIKVVEIQFPKSAAGENFRASYARIEEAERQFANGQYKQVLATLRLSFEGLAISLGFDAKERGVVGQCFESLFASSHPEKREKAREMLNGIYKFLHLGPHEQNNQASAVAGAVVSRSDARFALTLAYAIFEYITPRG